MAEVDALTLAEISRAFDRHYAWWKARQKDKR